MKLNFIKASPTENMTVFILNQLPRYMYLDIAKKIMNYSSIHAEQVGFIEPATVEGACARLHMMGGEFCVNATRALAAVLVQQNYHGITIEGNKFIVPLEVSGMNEIVNCEVLREDTLGAHRYYSTANIPAPLNLSQVDITYNGKLHNGKLVNFAGISHLVVDSSDIDSKEEFFKCVKTHLDYLDTEALGVMYYDYSTSFLNPLVYVKATDSLVWERGCGSGTAALGSVFSYLDKSDSDVVISQPGGDIQVKTKWLDTDNRISNITLSGLVDIIAEGILYI